MTPLSQIAIAYKKVGSYKLKSLLVIIPIFLLISGIILTTTEVNSIIKNVESTVISSVDNQNKIIELTKANGQNQPRGFGGGQPQDNTYSQTDIDKIKSIDGVDTVTLVDSLPIRPVNITNFEGVAKVNIQALSSLDPQLASIYTTDSFTYTEGQPIPIILSSNDLKETYEEWPDGKTSIDIVRQPRGQQSQGQTPPPNPADQNPIKTRSIKYDKNDILGKTITLNMGGFDDIVDYKQTRSQTGFTISKLTDQELADKKTTRQSDIAKYWNFDIISKPTQTQFKVVGITEGGDKTRTYIPTNAVSKVLTQYTTNEKAARNQTPIEATTYNTYQGLIYDGVSLKDDVSVLSAAQIRQVQGSIDQQNNQIRDAQNTPQPPQGQNRDGGQGGNRGFNVGQIRGFGNTSGYFIPGLIYDQNPETEAVNGQYIIPEGKTFGFDTQTLAVKIKTTDARTSIIEKLNTAGYSYRDNSNTNQVKTLKKNLDFIMNNSVIVLSVLAAIFVTFALIKFVQDSRKEIGVFRALGMSKVGIFIQYLSQSVILTVFGVIFGIIGGVAIVYIISNFMTSWFSSIVTNTLGQSIPIATTLTAQNFTQFDLSKALYFGGISITAILLVSLIPAYLVSRISPITAIREK
jgi:ABC-type antimicrobial peptide transport system permease subunit